MHEWSLMLQCYIRTIPLHKIATVAESLGLRSVWACEGDGSKLHYGP